MKNVVAILGILFLFGGSCFGVINWFFTEFYLESVQWEGPMVVVNRATWLLNILGMGIGGMLVGVAATMRSPDRQGLPDKL